MTNSYFNFSINTPFTGKELRYQPMHVTSMKKMCSAAAAYSHSFLYYNVEKLNILLRRYSGCLMSA
ncbi:hypothetical protein, partial [Paenibacillus zanthoxyli]|uniref:hypothetical protein n=1 Tax=Paenibacillus zanthoxyli TaxID=369399 RepID=UPI001E28ED63